MGPSRTLETRIKALEVHGSGSTAMAASAPPSACTTFREQVEHGDWLIAEQGLQPVDKIDVRLRVVPTRPSRSPIARESASTSAPARSWEGS